MRRILSLLLVALASATPAQAAWREASSENFLIYSEQSEKELRDFASRLERYNAAMRLVRSFKHEPVGPANRVTVYVVRDIRTVQRLFGKGASSGNFEVAGFYMPRATGSVAITPRWAGSDNKFETNAQIILLHEYAHDFLFRNFTGALPAWFIEGFAEFHSTAKFEKDGAVGLGTPAQHRAYGLLGGPRVPAELWLTRSVSELKPDQREALYGRGWLLTHYLTFEESRKGQLTTYLRLVNEGKGALEAARQAFGDLKQLDKELDEYLRRPRMTYWKLPSEQVKIGPIAVRTLSPAEDAVMDVKIRSRRGVDREAALALLPEVRRAAAPHATSAFAQATLAEAEYDAGNYKEAEAAADRAITADPKFIDGLIYKAMARMAQVEADKAAGKPQWAEVRKLIAAANRLDPDDPEPLILFYRSYASQGIEPTKNAVEGLIMALLLAPHDRGLRMMTAYQLLRDGRSKEAKNVLIPIAYDPHGGAMGKAASAVIAKLDAGDTKGALATADAAPDEDEAGEP